MSLPKDGATISPSSKGASAGRETNWEIFETMPKRLSAERSATDVKERTAWVESRSLRRLAVSVPFCVEDAVGYELSNPATMNPH